MKFLIDAQLPPGLCKWLEERGHQAEHVFGRGMGSSSDAEVAARAEAVDAILISKDEDFVALRLPQRFAFLWLRCGNATNVALAEWLDTRWERIEMLLDQGEGLVEVL